MKKIIFVCFLWIGFALAGHSQEIRWMSLNEALTLQKKNPKPIFIDVYTDWCGPCKLLDANTFRDANIVEYISRNYYPVKFNAEGNSTVNFGGESYTNPSFDANRKGRNSAHEFTTFLKVQGYPSMYIIDRNGNIREPIVGYVGPDVLIHHLK